MRLPRPVAPVARGRHCDPMPRDTTPRIFTMEEAARVLAVERSTVYKLVKRGVLRAVRVPGIASMRIRSEDIDAYLRGAVPVVVPVDDERPKRSRSRRAVA